nr:LLM class flavin-dependent oxidoreductase [Mycobacterium tuberculosis]
MPFERRAERTAEYVAAMRTLWRDDVASFDGNSRVVIVANCGWPWPWLILRVGDVDVLANWALTSWCWSRCHRIILRS